MKKYWPVLVVLLLSLGAIKPLLMPGFIPIHDNTQVVRVGQMGQALADGQFPVRWVRDLGYGYGYPIFNFYAPLAYYIGGTFNLLGFDALLATKIMMILGVLLAGVFMYLLAQKFWGDAGGIIASLFYVYAPYHALDIYVRGAVGEFWAIAFLPLVFYGLVQKSVIISALAFAGVILSHNLTALMAIPFILLVVMAKLAGTKNRKQFIIHNSKFIILALGLSAFYWLPALTEMDLTKVFGQIGAAADFRDHFVYLDQLWNYPWGFGGSAPGRVDGMSFMIGKLHVLVAALGLFVGLLKKKKVIFLPFLGLLLAIFMTNQISQPIWETISVMAFIQYPWRFLVFVTLAVSFSAGGVMIGLKKKQEALTMTAFIILLLLVFNLKYFQAESIFQTKPADYINEENIKWKTSKISDEYLPRDFPVPQNKNEVAWEKVIVVSGRAEISDLVNRSNRIAFNAQVKTDSEILVNLAYFPGWRFEVDGQEKDFVLDGDKIRFSLASGDYQISLRLINTPLRTAANLISLISWLGLVLFVLKWRKCRK